LKPRARPEAGFTLAEVAVTLVIVSFTLVLVLQGINVARSTAFNSHNRKAARELALLTLGRIESGLFWEDLDGDTGSFAGTYAEEGYEAFSFEVSIGEDLPVQEDAGKDGYFDTYAYRRNQELERQQDEEGSTADEETPFGSGSTGGSYERISVRVTFPVMGEGSNELQLERWIPLEQVYGSDPEESSDAEEDSGGSKGGEDGA
jgi:type II secretory pathway pseudopilin PulG